MPVERRRNRTGRGTVEPVTPEGDEEGALLKDVPPVVRGMTDRPLPIAPTVSSDMLVSEAQHVENLNPWPSVVRKRSIGIRRNP